MNTNIRDLNRTIGTAIRAMVIITVVLGPLYCLAITGVGQLIFPDQADGSLLDNSRGDVIGSRLIGQNFTDRHGRPLPQYFQPRPSAAGTAGYDGAGSSGSNLGPENPELLKTIKERKEEIATFNHIDPAAVPPDAVTASGSGLDPDISPGYARLQADRVARARHLPAQTVQRLVAGHIRGRALGFLGEPTVNVLELNLALDRLR